MASLSFLLLVAALSCVACAYDVSAKGRIVCHGRGLPYSRITLLDEDTVFDDVMGYATTDGNGYFTVKGSASDVHWRKSKRRPDVHIRNDLKHSSTRASFEIKQPTFRKDERSNTLHDRSGNVDFGTITFNSEACLTYLRFYDATHDFYSRVGYRVPFQVKISTEVNIHGGTPYALYDDIKLPKGALVSLTTAKHELAHTIRHRFDGSLSHFVKDAARYVYPRTHACSKQTNLGFAFNEGWAEYWAGSCTSNAASGSKTIEGNVASALRALQLKCRTSDRGMWDVLQRNPGRIHSYYSFEYRHKELHGC